MCCCSSARVSIPDRDYLLLKPLESVITSRVWGDLVSIPDRDYLLLKHLSRQEYTSIVLN